jgi:hypothetical protein
MSIEKFIDALEAGNTAEAKSVFSSEVRTRITDAIDSRRAVVGSAMGGQSDSEDEDV